MAILEIAPGPVVGEAYQFLLVLVQQADDHLGRVSVQWDPDEQRRHVQELALAIDHLGHLRDCRPAIT